MSVDILSWLDEVEPAKPVQEVRTNSTDTLVTSEINGTCFEIQREVLLSLLEKAISVVPSRDIIPVMTNFQFQVYEDKLRVVASSLDMSISLTTDQIKVSLPGTEVFPARTFLNLVKESSAGTTVYVEATTQGVVVAAGNFSAEIAMMSGKDFPRIASVDDVVFHEVNRLAFIEAITTVKYALPNKDFSGQDSLRMINIKGGKFTACDGSRFQQTRIEGFKLNMKLPSDNVSLILKILGSSDIETLEIGETAKQLIFRLGNVVLYRNKIDSPYPNVEQLWLRPALNNDQELIVNKQELLTAIKQVRIVTDTESNAIALILHSDHIEIKARDTLNNGVARVSSQWQGKQRIVVVNYIHLAEMLKAYPLAECNFYLGEDMSSRKSSVLLKNPDTLAISTISQMLSYRAGLTG